MKMKADAGQQNFNYHRPDPALMDALDKISLMLTGQWGYWLWPARHPMDATTGKLYMLEVNAQCGWSEDEIIPSERFRAMETRPLPN